MLLNGDTVIEAFGGVQASGTNRFTAKVALFGEEDSLSESYAASGVSLGDDVPFGVLLRIDGIGPKTDGASSDEVVLSADREKRAKRR